MNSRRTARVAEAIREAVSTGILFEIRDPRVQNVTVISAEVSSDLQNAKVYVSIMGDEKDQRLCLHGLNSCKGFLQRRVAERMKSRYTPVLKFVLDEGVKRSVEATQILKDVLPEPDEGDEDVAIHDPAETEELLDE